MTPTLYVRNLSTLVNPVDFDAMVHACHEQVVSHAAPAWGRRVWHVSALAKSATPPAGASIIDVFDTPDQANALGWHSEGKQGIFGKVFARPSLDAGSTALTGQYAISSVLSHEVLETLIDPDVNGWWQIDDGVLVAAEVCDPVEDVTYNITVNSRPVAVSDFVLPAWANPYVTGRPFDYAHRATKAFEVTKGGYVVLWDVAKNHVGNVYGEEFPEWKRELKEQATARNARRRSRHPA